MPEGSSLAWRPWGILVTHPYRKKGCVAEFLSACSKNFAASAATPGVGIVVRIQKLYRWTRNGKIQHGSAGDTQTTKQECGSPEGSS